MDRFGHETVMLHQTIEALMPCNGRLYADATCGAGGHSQAILESSAPSGKVIAVDRDQKAVERTQQRLAAYAERAIVIQGEFADLQLIFQKVGAERVHGLIADLGLSSLQLDDAERGFSFSVKGPLDMRMDTSAGETAAELITRLEEQQLADVIYRFGEERRSRAIARSIKRALAKGQMSNTEDLRRAVVRVLGPRKRGKIDPATRTFQALRIFINRELEQLQHLVESLPDLLEDNGVAVIISFHSLEDRIVKNAFRSDQRMEPLSRRPLSCSETERQQNPRARSARLRAARRTLRRAS